LGAFFCYIWLSTPYAMKKLFVLSALLSALFCNAQDNVPLSLKDALEQARIFSDAQLKPSFSPEIEYYSKHYEDVFGKYLYTFDHDKSGTRYVYANDNRFYFAQNNSYMSQISLGGPLLPSLSTAYNSLELVNVLSSLLGGEKIDFTIKVK